MLMCVQAGVEIKDMEEKSLKYVSGSQTQGLVIFSSNDQNIIFYTKEHKNDLSIVIHYTDWPKRMLFDVDNFFFSLLTQLYDASFL